MTSDSAQFLLDIVEDDQTRLLDTLKDVIRQHHSEHPRSQQDTLGPSQIGHPCARHLTQQILGHQPINAPFDPLPSYIGVASHKHVEDAVALDNSRNGERWISERRLQIGSIHGTADLFDTNTSTVIDLKFPGTTAMTGYRKDGPSEVYRKQVHLYGYGYQQAGVDVKHVGIWFIPRGGTLASSHLWIEPYQESIAVETLQRYESLLIVADELERSDAAPSVVPVTPGKHCMFCPWYVKDLVGQPDTACNANGIDPRKKQVDG